MAFVASVVPGSGTTRSTVGGAVSTTDPLVNSARQRPPLQSILFPLALFKSLVIVTVYAVSLSKQNRSSFGAGQAVLGINFNRLPETVTFPGISSPLSFRRITIPSLAVSASIVRESVAVTTIFRIGTTPVGCTEVTTNVADDPPPSPPIPPPDPSPPPPPPLFPVDDKIAFKTKLVIANDKRIIASPIVAEIKIRFARAIFSSFPPLVIQVNPP